MDSSSLTIAARRELLVNKAAWAVRARGSSRLTKRSVRFLHSGSLRILHAHDLQFPHAIKTEFAVTGKPRDWRNHKSTNFSASARRSSSREDEKISKPVTVRAIVWSWINYLTFLILAHFHCFHSTTTISYHHPTGCISDSPNRRHAGITSTCRSRPCRSSGQTVRSRRYCQAGGHVELSLPGRDISLWHRNDGSAQQEASLVVAHANQQRNWQQFRRQEENLERQGQGRQATIQEGRVQIQEEKLVRPRSRVPTRLATRRRQF